jgi:protein O-mannosyl-transferase
MSHPAEPAAVRRGSLAAVALLLVAGVMAYWNSLRGPFVFDDVVSIVENPTLQHLTIGSVLRPPADTGVGGRPLANLSFALNHAANGNSVVGYHAVNLLIHLAGALLLFAILRRILAREPLLGRIGPMAIEPLAAAVAALWLLHPLQTETVTYISQRTESLMAMFYLATIFAFIRGTERQAGSIGWFAAAVIACAAGMATKEVMVTAPVMVLLIDRTLFAGTFREAWRQRHWLYLGLAATWMVVAAQLAGVANRGVTYAAVTWWQYGLTECGAILHYLRLALWPAPLVFDYGMEVTPSIGAAIPALVAVVALGVATVIALVRRPVLGLCGAWLFVLLAPTSSIVPIAGQPIAEHRMYLPLAAVVAVAMVALWRVVGQRLVVPMLAAAAIALGCLTHNRNATFSSVEGLWRDTIAKVPANGRAHAALGIELLHQGKRGAAISELQVALRLNPNDAEARNNLATALQDEGRLTEAIEQFRASARLEPNSATTRYNFGNALLEAGNPGEALTELQRAVSLRPTLAEAHGALGNALVALGRTPEALVAYEQALRLKLDLPAVHFALANVLAQAGRVDDALPHYDATARALPAVPDAHFNYANALLAAGRIPDAIGQYEQVVRLAPNLPEAHNNLGIALVRAGRVTEARAQFEAALRLRPDFAAARQNLEDLLRLSPGNGSPR